jgi:uncharacterized circularly permuted ATP-grasp superfamily protein/uncharacterized alpha-E superfamily protein
MGFVQGLSPEERSRRLDVARRNMSEQGVTYNVYGDSRGMERPWVLDPLPLVISAQEWRWIESGLIQRARLLNAVLADCYGPQRLLGSGHLPPALVFGQRDFVRAACGVPVKGGTHLNLYAADLARGADGRWWLLSDRTQIPTGTGYALANRLVTARVLPEAFRELNVNRLAVFFRQLRESLVRAGPRPGEEPRVAILTPGPYNETYFEQAYLARYLGYTLVEGQDLIVDDGRVFLKTLSGLERIDVILRRVDDGFCDPLELRNDSMLGVPGLVEALRSGTVSMANSLGSGLVQSPAFGGFLPGLCRTLLGEELQMPSRATWWCGQEGPRRYVLEHLEELVVRPALGDRRVARGPLREEIEFAPHAWAAQEPMQISRVPCWEEGEWVERPVVLRVYLCATEDGYVAMPGGLARTGLGVSEGGISMQEGGASKDVWVRSESPVEEATLLEGSRSPVELRRVGNNLPSRLADNFFWLGRYNERLDGAARTLRATLLRFSPEGSGSELRILQPLLLTLEGQDQIRPGSSAEGRSSEALEADFAEAVQGESRPGCLRPLAEKLVHLAMLVRDRTSNDVWRALTELERSVFAGSGVWSVGESLGILNRVLMLSASFKGIVRENMTRSQGWRFLDMGQRLERALGLSLFLRQTLRSPESANPSLLESILEVADSTITYRSRYNLRPNLMAVYDLVLLDETNPRSLLFQLIEVQRHLERLPRTRTHTLLEEDERLMLELLTRVRLLDPTELSGSVHLADSETARTLEVVIQRLPKLSEVLSAEFFTHSRVSAIRSR